ncbi:hypothetical protein [Streptomyces sp. cg35]|uniref:hypothetical protein n=1 Tax=Streptomyces sp. cg35 TaxID=3421650 RepID=UPI003D17BD94
MGAPWRPWVVGGDVYNFTCTQGAGCGCGPAVPTVRLAGPVHKVVGVVVDGTELPADAYAVYDQRDLVRLDGKGWPCCQRLDKPLTEPGTWAVNYERGKPLSVAGRRALGALACEFTRLCVGDKCRLPSRVTNVSRDGVTWQIDPSTFYAEGLTGITEVDLWIKAVNPHQRQRRASSRNIDRPSPGRVRSFPRDTWGSP